MATTIEKIDMGQEEIRGKLEKVFGGEWADKYKEKSKNLSMKRARLTVTPELRKEIVGIAKSKLTPESPLVSFNADGSKFHIALVETPGDIKTRIMSWTKSVSMLWDNKWFGANFNKEMEHFISGLTGTTPYVLVGNMVNKADKNGKLWYNFDVMDLLTMDDLLGESKPSMAYDEDTADEDASDEDLTKEE